MLGYMLGSLLMNLGFTMLNSLVMGLGIGLGFKLLNREKHKR